MLSIGEGIFIGIAMFIIGTFFGYSMGSLNKFAPKQPNAKLGEKE